MLTLIETASHAYVNDTATISIITEEASAYFSGAKSIDETMRLIQSRLDIYMNE